MADFDTGIGCENKQTGSDPDKSGARGYPPDPHPLRTPTPSTTARPSIPEVLITPVWPALFDLAVLCTLIPFKTIKTYYPEPGFTDGG